MIEKIYSFAFIGQFSICFYAFLNIIYVHSFYRFTKVLYIKQIKGTGVEGSQKKIFQNSLQSYHFC